jgi:Uma2 family endonuclease
MLEEIVLPETKPETEWVRGRAVQKVSPTRNHARLQLVFAAALDVWAAGRGEVGTEWRFRVGPPGERRRPLVPDVAFVRSAQLSELSDADMQTPALAPTVAIEILSPDDNRKDVASKIDVYLRAGTELVVVIDPRSRTMTLHDSTGTKTLSHTDVFKHAALPDFELSLEWLFSKALDRSL